MDNHKFFLYIIYIITTTISCHKDTHYDVIPTCSLEVIRTIGVEYAQDSCYMFGDIKDICCLGDNRIYVLDKAYSCIKIFDQVGTYLGQISRRGSGPGELINPVSMTITENGEIVVVHSGGVSTFSSDGDFLENPLSGCLNPPIKLAGYSGDSFIGFKCDFVSQSNGQLLSVMTVGLYNRSENPEVIYHSDSILFDPSNIGKMVYSAYNEVAFATDASNVCIAPISSHEYKLTLLSSTADTLSEYICYPTMNRKTEEEFEHEIEYYNNMFQFENSHFDANPYRNIVTDIQFNKDSQLWVMRGSELVPSFDVYNSELEPIYRAVLPRCINNLSDGGIWRFSIGSNYIYLWSETPIDYQRIYILTMGTSL